VDGDYFHSRRAPDGVKNGNWERCSSQYLMRGLGLLDAERHLVGDADAVAFESDDFLRVIGEDANVLEAKVDQDLRADAAFVLHHALAGGLAIELAALVKMDLREPAFRPSNICAFFRGASAQVRESPASHPRS